MQPDPIGTAGGMNLYAYVENSPLEASDPYGLDINSISVHNNHAIVNLIINIYGAENLASVWGLSTYQKEINNRWNSQKWKYGNCTVSFNIIFTQGAETKNFLSILPVVGRSVIWNNTQGYIYQKTNLFGLDWEPFNSWFFNVSSHEMGHFMGFLVEGKQDMYDKNSKPLPGWEKTLMGDSWFGSLTQNEVGIILDRYYGK